MKDQVLSFDIYSLFGIFKKNDINESFLTYNWIPKPFVLGILGNILGLGGYGSPSFQELEPEYYKFLKHLKLAIQPISRYDFFNETNTEDSESMYNFFFNGTFKKTMIKYNNALGYASKEEGGILNVIEQVLVQPSFRIYLDLEDFANQNKELAEKLENYIKNYLSEYIPYMGKNEFYLYWKNVQFYEKQDKSIKKQIHSIFKKEIMIKDKLRLDFEFNKFMIYESLPTEFKILTNQKGNRKIKDVYYHYKIEEFAFTNFKFKELPVKNITCIKNENGEFNVYFF